MKFELADNKIFKDCFLTVGEIIDEIILECDSEGIRCKALDKSHVSFVNLELHAALFDSYSCKTPEKIILDSNELIKILKRIKPSDILYGESEESNFILRYGGDSNRTFRLRCIDAEYESAQPPLIDHPVSITLSSELFKDFLEDILLFDENIKFIVDEDYLIASCNGDTGDTECRYIHGEFVDEVYKSSFSIKMLKGMMKAKSISKTCTLRLGNDLPLILRFETMDKSCGLEFLLAPRISEED